MPTEPEQMSPQLHEVASQQTPIPYLRRLWQRRSFIVALSTEKIRTRHQDNVLGGLWHLLNPLLTVGVYFVVFGGILNSSRGVDNFLAWLAIGVFAYRLTSNAATSGSTAISSNEGLIRSLRFPRATLPLSIVIGDIYTFRFDLVAILIISIAMGVMPSANLSVIPVVLLLHSLLNAGLSMIAARLGDTVRDVQQLIPFIFRLMQFMSGVMYPISRFADSSHSWAYRVLRLNPVVHLIDMYRWAFLGTPIAVTDVLICSVACVLVAVIGFRYFIAAEIRYGRA